MTADTLLVESEGWPISLRLGGARGGPGTVDVVLLHGIPGSAESWSRVVEYLPRTSTAARRAIRSVVPDLLGFGASGRPDTLDDLHAESQAAHLCAALAEAGVERPLLVGHDFGGPVALRMVMAHPGRFAGLVLAATNAFADTPVPFPLSLVNAPFVGGAFARLLFSRAALRGMCRFGARSGRVDAGAAVGDDAQAAAIRTIFAGSLTALAALYGPIERALPSLGLPALVVWGDRDPFFPLAAGQRTAAAVPGARLEVLSGCGHFIPDEQPERLAALIATFAVTTAA